MLVDLHNHTTLCNHATGNMRGFVEKAISQGVKYFGFSDHAPMNFDMEYRMKLSEMRFYENQVKLLKDEYAGKIEILLGYEVDFLDGFIESAVLNSKVDYFIGSVHFINKWGFDNPEYIKEYENKDIDLIWSDYFEAISNMAKSGLFDIVGHLDLLKVFKFLPKKDIKMLALEAIKEIKKANMVVELNVAGLRKPINEQYPSRELLELIFEHDIDITFGSDAHSIEQVGFMRNEIIDLAKSVGFDRCVVFKNRDKEYLKI
ncbi:MAG: histidinol-phosphatase [Campylobacterales bacterium]|nr:histidinol-phosphatase [Campylobacterales bacterium]